MKFSRFIVPADRRSALDKTAGFVCRTFGMDMCRRYMYVTKSVTILAGIVEWRRGDSNP